MSRIELSLYYSYHFLNRKQVDLKFFISVCQQHLPWQVATFTFLFVYISDATAIKWFAALIDFDHDAVSSCHMPSVCPYGQRLLLASAPSALRRRLYKISNWWNKVLQQRYLRRGCKSNGSVDEWECQSMRKHLSICLWHFYALCK